MRGPGTTTAITVEGNNLASVSRKIGDLDTTMNIQSHIGLPIKLDNVTMLTFTHQNSSQDNPIQLLGKCF